MRTFWAACVAVLLTVPAFSETRVALVIANSGYTAVAPLSTPASDANLVAGALRQSGFVVTVKQNAGKAALEDALQDFGRAADAADVALVYYAGHGIEADGTNFLVPIDAKLEKARNVSLEAVSLQSVLSSIEGARRLRLVVLDACRNNPFKLAGRDGKRAVSRGLVRVDPSGDTLVAYAAKDGTTAADGLGNSPFAQAFAKEITVPGQEVQFVFRKIHDDVLTATGREQEPALYGSLSAAEFYFVGGQATVNVVAPAPVSSFDPREAEVAFWKSVEGSGDRAELQSYLDAYPQGIYAGAARAKIAKLQPVAVVTPPPAPVSAVRGLFAPPVQYAVDAAHAAEREARAKAESAQRKSGEVQGAAQRARAAAEAAKSAAAAAKAGKAEHAVQDGKNSSDKGWHYEGQVAEDAKANGYGIFTLSDNGRYEGEWHGDKRDGVGVNVWADGGRYEGEYSTDKKNGAGVYVWTNGDRYVGEFRDDKISGLGIYSYSSGDRYEGEEHEEKKNGAGVYSGGADRKYREEVGQWSGDKLNGYVAVYWKDGSIWVGHWKDNNLDGYGAQLDAAGNVTEQGYYEAGTLKTAMRP